MYGDITQCRFESDGEQNPPLVSRLAWLSDDRAIHNPDRPTDSFFRTVRDIFPKQFDTQTAKPFFAVAQAFEQSDIRDVGPVRQLSEHNRLPQE
jgi:hypothetical protein